VDRLVEKYGLDTAHWLGEAHVRGKTHSWSPSIPLDEILVERSTYTNRVRLGRRLLAAGLLRYACAGCGISSGSDQRWFFASTTSMASATTTV
jgi:hypothetical protein